MSSVSIFQTMIDLVTQQQEKIAEHCRRLNVRRLDVFGSAARGEDFDPETSDVDFLVNFDKHGRLNAFDQYFELVESLEALFGRKVDLVEDRHFENPYFRASVEESRKPVYGA